MRATGDFRIFFGWCCALIVVFCMLLWPHRLLRRYRQFPLGKAEGWFAGHVWLGILAVPLLLFHCGWRGLAFQSGLLTNATMAVFLAVIATGILCIFLQHVIPRRISERIGEDVYFFDFRPIRSEVVYQLKCRIYHACGRSSPTAPEGPDWARRAVVTHFDSAEGVQGQRRQLLGEVEQHLLLEEFEQTVEPYLIGGYRTSSIIESTVKSKRFFADLGASLGNKGKPLVADMETWCHYRRQSDLVRRTLWWLRIWRACHIVLACLLVILVLLHVIEVY